MRQQPGVLSVANNAHLTAALAAAKAAAGKAGAHGRPHHPPPLPVIQEDCSFRSSGPTEQNEPLEDEDDPSPLSKFKDYKTVASLEGQPPAPTSARLAPAPQSSADRVQARARHAAVTVAADVGLLVRTTLRLVVGVVGAQPGTSQAGTGAGTSAGTSAGDDSLADCLQVLEEPGVLALATDCVLAELLHGLQPLLRYNPYTRQWGVPGVASILGPLQHAIQERMQRTSLPCDAELAVAAAHFFVRAIQQAGSNCVEDAFLAAVATYAHDSCRLLSGEVLASLLVLLVTARYQPSQRISFGNRCVERLLRLRQGKPGLGLKHLADVVEALAQLHCIDGLSASPVVNLAAGYARELEEGGRLEVSQLTHLARVMNGVAVVAATTTVQPGTLLAATAAWHLLTARAEALAQQSAGLGPALSRMWSTSRLLCLVTRATGAPAFQLPDRLGLISHAAWLDQEHKVSAGLTSAQRRVLAALGALKVPPGSVAVNSDFLDCFQICIAVRMREKSSGKHRSTAILLRDPQRHLLRKGGSAGRQLEALGALTAQERILQAAGWQVVCLDSQSCLHLPAMLLAEELGSLMMGEPGSLSFLA